MSRRDTAIGLLVALAWGLNFVAIGKGLHELPALLFVGLRFLLAAFPLALVVPRPDVPWRTVAALGVLVGAGQFGLLYLGIAEGMPAGLSSVVLQAQMPFTVLLGAVLLRERPTWRQAAGLTVAVGGLVVIGAHRGAAVPLLAVALVTGGGACWAGANVLTRSARSRRPFSLLVHSSAVSAVCVLGLSLLVDGPTRDVDALRGLQPVALASLLYIVLVATLAGYGAWYWLLGRYASATVAAFPLLAPVAALSSAWVLLGEDVPLAQLLGAALVVSGVAYAIASAGSGAHAAPDRQRGPTALLGASSRWARRDGMPG